MSVVPLWGHAIGLLVVLLLLIPVVGTRGLFSSDEGATLLVAKQLAEGGGWVVAHPVPKADPAGLHYPFETYEVGVDGRSPYAKHPVHVLALAATYRAFGSRGVVVLSCLAVVAAGMAGAALSGQLGGGRRRTVLWAIGLGSPLLFDAYLVMGHAIGAAFCGLAVAAAVAAERRRWLLAAVGPAVAVAALVRSEAVLFGVALGVVLLVVAAFDPAHRAVRVIAAAKAVTAAALVRLGEPLMVNAVLGGGDRTGGAALPAEEGSRGFFLDRIDGSVHSLLGLSDGDVRLAFGLVLATTLAGALFLRRRPDPGLSLVVVGLATGAMVLRVSVGGGGMVTGLVPAFPLLVAGLVVLRRPALRTWRIPLATSAVFAALVVATQYRIGGSTEWGGRYFAPVVPLVVPVAVAGLAAWAAVAPLAAARRAGFALGLVVVTLSGSAVAELHDSHRLSQRFVDRVLEVAAAQPDARPVVVSSQPLLPRFAWDRFHQARWLLADDDEVGALAGQLRAAGVDRFVFITVVDPGKPDMAVPGSRLHRVASAPGLAQWRLYEVTPG